MGPGMFDGLGTFIRFAIWAIPILGIIAAWKVIEVIVWACHHIHFS